MPPYSNRLYKICIVGDGGVGKTTILHRFVDGVFLENAKLTIGTNFFLKSVKLEDENIKVILQIWDLSGQERFSIIRPNFYSGAKGIIYTFDLTRKLSLINLLKWKNEIEHVIGETPSILLGNKIDLILDIGEQIILKEECELKRKQINAQFFFETSAKNNIGISKAFNIISRRIYESLKIEHL
ncbi:MAG: GTP-binding protein [Candidatus Lokiarchaeota archaeon]|nr:GTP-binding protein [Candidatus Lokiarchaeota archaeon]